MTQFLLNGVAKNLDFAPGTTLLDYLRLAERLTGTKEGCAEGDCGACTVALGRRHGSGIRFFAVNACIMLAADLHGSALVTVEAVAQNGELAPLQNAMVDLHASQCGFCTPGFVMSLYALNQNPKPENPRAAILDALAGNLCRCTGYRPILAAAETLDHVPDSRIAAWAAALANIPPDPATPQTLAELDSLLSAAPDRKLTAGTTDIGVPIAKDGKIPPRMLSLRAIPELQSIEDGPSHLRIGAAAPYTEILPYLDKYFAGFAALIRRIGSVQIRNSGSMGGNLCNASPIGDSAPCLIALGAALTLRSAAGERSLNVEDFFTAYRQTALAPGEYLRAIAIPKLAPDQKFFAYKNAKRFDQDISTLAAAFLVTTQNNTIAAARAAFGGMAATPIRAPAIDAALIGQPITPATFAAAAAQASSCFQPISDFRASAGYRRQAAAAFLHRLGAELRHEPADIWEL